MSFKDQSERRMVMELSTQEYKRVAVVEISGRIDAARAPDLEAELQELLSKGHQNLILDMAKVEFVSSSGLRVMLTARKSAQKSGGDLSIAQPSERVKDTLDIAGLDVIFKTYEDRETAIGSY
jgi:anti-sigma B factor antagonist